MSVPRVGPETFFRALFGNHETMTDFTEPEGRPMRAPQMKYEVNITTVIALIGLFITFGGMIWAGGQFHQSVNDLDNRFRSWVTTHEQLHKDRLAQVSASDARMDTRIGALEATSRQIDNLTYRLTVQEQGAVTLSQSVNELKQSVNSQSADIRVIREILTRLDPASTRER